ncbi:hypothetical protein [Rhodococcus koreensis]|uniref:hypothetical protein n=1 Tax=Rhodococcus koreensis TaxID=99653 RepID=UPI00366AB25F
MSDKPMWRRAFDVVERNVSPRVEALVHTSQSARAAAAVARTRRRVGDQLDGLAAQVLHLFNLPARTDIQQLRRQVGAVDRDVRRLSAELDHRARQHDQD